jgi:hypothetical protein
MIFFPEIKTLFQKSQKSRKCAINFFMVIFVRGPPPLDTLTPSRYATTSRGRLYLSAYAGYGNYEIHTREHFLLIILRSEQ